MSSIASRHVFFDWLDGILHSYSQIFFSKSRSLALLVIFATFINPDLGIWGLAAVLLTNVLAYLLGFAKKNISEGLYGLNSLLVVLGLAASFKVNTAYILIVFAACLLTLFMSVAWMNYLSGWGLPFLSLPFLTGFWVVILAAKQYTGLELDDSNIFFLNELYRYGGTAALEWYDYWINLPIPQFFAVYFKSLSAIVFQDSTLAGMLIALGLLFSSRIAFSLSLLGYAAGYLFYTTVGGDFTQLYYSYIGFNFILTAIAIGGFFFISTTSTYVLTIIITPLISITIAAFSSLFLEFQLPILSLPFAIIVIMTIYVLKFAPNQKIFKTVNEQHYSPERNLYAYRNYKRRFNHTTFYHIGLPFFGTWGVSQAHDGEHTHQDDWRHAWDFVIQDSKGKTHQGDGTELSHYYSYGLPVVAPQAGWVVDINDGIEDNLIGDMNLQHNWGNSIVIKHAEHFYTQISHLKEDSFQVKVGDYVKKGDLLGYLGNSGRSPEPHIHFQVQSTPYIGSKTLNYPITYYMQHNAKGKFDFKSYSYPKKGDQVFNVQTTKLLQEAFHFIPGQVLKFRIRDKHDNIQEIKWEVYTTAKNQSYLYCPQSGSVAYFVNDGTLHYFSSFEGDKSSILYYFYLGAYKVLLGFYKEIQLEDSVPLHLADGGLGLWLHDFTAPFFTYRKLDYKMDYLSIDNTMRPKEIKLQSRLEQKVAYRKSTKITFDWTIQHGKIAQWSIQLKDGWRWDIEQL